MRKLGLAGCAAAMVWVGCSEVTIPDDPSETPPDPPVKEAPQALVTEKVDVLLVVDNSASMADKQGVLAKSAIRLVRDLTNPPCVDEQGTRFPQADQPASPQGTCPPGGVRVANPVEDLRIGVISSSLGALTSNQCDGGAGADPSDNDGGRLITRGPTGDVPTYQGLGFLAWDPSGQMSPPGDADLADFEAKLADIVTGVGQVGCGYEMPLEAMARFLVDPAPHAALERLPDNTLAPQGVDTVLLAQREAFLRPDSLVSVILLADENDCSVSTMGQGYLALEAAPFYRSTYQCELDPSDACCTSCALELEEGCQADPLCGVQGSGAATKYSPAEDQANLRCWEQKRRYGVDFLFPVERYENALSETMIAPDAPDLSVGPTGGVPNPLFAGGRSPELVSLTAVVGVPWQDLVADPTNPDSRLKSTSEMEDDGTWSLIVQGGDPFMIESIGQRTGSNPITGESPSGPNGINGGDRSIALNDDLQYACTFALPTPQPNGGDCGSECQDDPTCDDPICDGSTQIGAKAYPGLRHLELVRALGDRGIAGSICPSDFGASNAPTPQLALTGYDRPIIELEARMFKFLPKP